MTKIVPFKRAREELEKKRRKPRKLYECKWNASKQRLEPVSFEKE